MFKGSAHVFRHWQQSILGPVYLRFMVDKVTLGQVCLWVLWVFLLLSYHQSSMLIFLLLLLLSKGQTGEACEPPNKVVLFWILGSTAT